MREDLSFKIEALRNIPLFMGLGESLLEMLAERCQIQRYNKRKLLFNRGDSGYDLYIILSGSIELQRENEQGTPLRLTMYGAGGYIGELSLLDGAPRSADAIASAGSRLLIISHREFMKCLESSPKFARNLIKSLAARLREAHAEKELSKKTVRHRLAEMFLELAEQNEEPLTSRSFVSLPLTHQAIADQFNVQRETVTRALAKLQSEKVIKADKKGYLVSIKKLHEITE